MNNGIQSPYDGLHYKNCLFPNRACDCDTVPRARNVPRNKVVSRAGDPQPQQILKEKPSCMILDYTVQPAPVPHVPMDLEKPDAPRMTAAVSPRPYQLAAITESTVEHYQAACRDLLARIFPGADLRFVGPFYSVSQEAPPQNRFTARFAFPFNHIEGRGPDELDAFEELYTNMHKMAAEANKSAPPVAGFWADPEVGPLEQVGSIAYDDSELERPGLPQNNPAFVRGYEFVTPDYSFVQSVDTQPKVDSARGNWYPLVRQEAYDKLQDTVRNLTESLRAAQYSADEAEERAEKFRQEVISLRTRDDGNGLPISTLAAGIQAALAGFGQIIVQADLHARYRKAEEHLQYLTRQDIHVRWAERNSLPYVAQLRLLPKGEVDSYLVHAVCGYEADGAPITFDTVDLAIEHAMLIIPFVKEAE